MDYSKFEGKVIRFIDSYGTEIEAFVVGIEYDIGITIIANKDRGRYLACLKGPSARPDLYIDDSDYLEYDEFFENALFMIQDGFLDERVIDDILLKHGLEPQYQAGPDVCPFNK
jgi:hypothetical protein